jgi:TetR/AcrR family transcriptional repressor of nem operon
MGRPSDARERILTAGTALLGRGAYSSISVADICAAAGVPKGSFYYFFESKQAFALAVIARHWVAQKAQWAMALAGDEAPLERLHRLFDATTETQRASQRELGAVTGCLFGNLALELSAHDPLIKLELQRVFDEQVGMVQAAVEDSIEAGESSPASAAVAARAIIAQLEGTVLFAKLLDDPEQVNQLWPNALLLLNAPVAVEVG